MNIKIFLSALYLSSSVVYANIPSIDAQIFEEYQTLSEDNHREATDFECWRMVRMMSMSKELQSRYRVERLEKFQEGGLMTFTLIKNEERLQKIVQDGAIPLSQLQAFRNDGLLPDAFLVQILYNFHLYPEPDEGAGLSSDITSADDTDLYDALTKDPFLKAIFGKGPIGIESKETFMALVMHATSDELGIVLNTASDWLTCWLITASKEKRSQYFKENPKASSKIQTVQNGNIALSHLQKLRTLGLLPYPLLMKILEKFHLIPDILQSTSMAVEEEEEIDLEPIDL